MKAPCIIPRLISDRKNTNHLMFREMVKKYSIFLCLHSRQNQIPKSCKPFLLIYNNTGDALYVSVNQLFLKIISINH